MAFVRDGFVYIPLQKSPGRKRLFAIIEETDYERVAQHSWHAVWSGRTFYVRTGSPNVASHHRHLHSFILKVQPGQRVDHRDGNGLNNRRSNLREATAAQNGANSFKARKDCTSKFKGVMLTSSGRWAATITADGSQRAIGLFDDETDAARAYDAAALAAFGEFAKTNEAMGLFQRDNAVRLVEGADIADTRKIGEFRRPTEMSVRDRIFDDPEYVGDRRNVGAVVALRRHKKHKGYLYKLDTGDTVAPQAYLGSHPTPEEYERMKQELLCYEAAKRARKRQEAA